METLSVSILFLCKRCLSCRQTYTVWYIKKSKSIPSIQYAFYRDIYLFFYLICCNIASVLCFGFLVARHIESYFPNEGLNPHPLHWKVKSYSLDCQGSPRDVYLYRETLGKNWKGLHQINHSNHCWAKENESRLWVMVQFSSVQLLSCVAMNCNMPGFPVYHQLPELAQTHVHRVGDAIQPSHSLLSPSPLAFNLFQHQGLFQRVSSHQVELQLQHQSLQWIFRTDFL